MKKILLTIISALIIILSSVLAIHLMTNDEETINNAEYDVDAAAEISKDIDELTLDEEDEIDIGEMI